MKFLQLLAIAFPLTAILSTLPAVAAPSLVVRDAAHSCQRNNGYVWLNSEEDGTPINIRDDASTQAYARHIGYAGNSVEVLNQKIGEGGYCWYRVRFESRATGWVRGDFVLPNNDGE